MDLKRQKASSSISTWITRFLAIPSSQQLASRVEQALRHGTKILVAIALIMLVLELLAPLKAHAGGPATGGASEFTQILNNIELVDQTIQDQARNIQLVQQTYLQQLQQLSQTIGPYTAPFQRAFAAYQSVRNAQAALLGLQGSVGNLRDILNTRFNEFSSSMLTFEAWQQRELKLIQNGDGRARAEIESNQAVLQSTQDSLNAYSLAAAAMEQTTGTHQATRMLGAQLTLLGGDINKLVALTAQTNAVRALEVQESAADRKRALDDAARIRAEQRALDLKNMQELDAILAKHPGWGK